MLKQKGKVKYDKWVDDRISKGYTFKYTVGVLFGVECKTLIRCVESGEELVIDYSEPTSKLKFAPELVTAVRLNMFKRKAWLKNKYMKKSDMKCSNCGKQYEHLDGDIAFMSVTGSLNKAVCHTCGLIYLKLGAEDIEKKINDMKTKKETLIEEIKGFGNYRETRWTAKLVDMRVEELESLHVKIKAEKQESDRIDAIVIPESDVGMEEYLEKEYGVIEDSNWLKCEEQIESHFKDDSYDLFDCGQGYYQDEAYVICKIGLKFYGVTIKAEVWGEKQDRGDKLYHVESIENVSWVEIDKPEPKDKVSFTYSFCMTKDDKLLLDQYLASMKMGVIHD